MTIPEYSQSRVGRIWTADDNYWLITQILRIEFLAEECIRAAQFDTMREGDENATSAA